MPLFKSKSKKAFSHNVETEMEHGKPQAQALAIAYRLKRGHASGGTVESGDPTMNYAKGGELQAIPKSRLEKGGSGGGSRRYGYWKTPGGTAPRTNFPAGTADEMRSVDMQTGKYKMHGPKGELKAHGGEMYGTSSGYGGRYAEGGLSGTDYKKRAWNEEGVHKATVNEHSSMGNAVRPSGIVNRAMRHQGEKPEEYARSEAHRVLKEMRSMKGPTSGKSGFAEGGMLTDSGYQSECNEHCNYPCDVHMSEPEGYAKGGKTDAEGRSLTSGSMAYERHDAQLAKEHRQYEELQAKRGESYGHESTGVHSPSYSYGRDRGASMAGDLVRGTKFGSMGKHNIEGAKDIHRQTLREAAHMKGPTTGKSGFAEGGEADDLVSRIMRARGYSEGGEIANTDEPCADELPAEYDDLHLRDDLEFDYTGANSGDEVGNAGEDERRRDMVSRIMAARRKR